MMLGGQNIPPRDPQVKFYLERRWILARRIDQDPISLRVDVAMKEIEVICRPVISERARRNRIAGNRSAHGREANGDIRPLTYGG